jgi:hypothetical protein
MQNRKGLRWIAGNQTPDSTYITRVINFGTLEEWRQLRKKYSHSKIKQALKKPLRGQWTRHGKAFAEVIFGVHLPKSVLISYE